MIWVLLILSTITAWLWLIIKAVSLRDEDGEL